MYDVNMLISFDRMPQQVVIMRLISDNSMKMEANVVIGAHFSQSLISPS